MSKRQRGDIEIAGFQPLDEITCMGQRHAGFTALSGSGLRIEIAQSTMLNGQIYREMLGWIGRLAQFIDSHGILDRGISDDQLASVGLERLRLNRGANEGWLYVSTDLTQPVIVKQRHGAGADIQHYGLSYIAPTLAEKSTWLRAAEPYAMIMLANDIGATIMQDLSGYPTLNQVLGDEATTTLLAQVEAEAERIFGRAPSLMGMDMGVRFINDIVAEHAFVAPDATPTNLGFVWLIDQPAADTFGNCMLAIKTIAETDPDFQPSAWAPIMETIAKMSSTSPFTP